MEKKKEHEKGLSKVFWYILFGVCLCLVIIVTIGFVAFANREEEVINKTEKGGNINLKYTNNVNGLRISQVTPVADSIGMKNSNDGEYFDFSVDFDIDNASSIEYEISAIKNSKNSTITDDDIKIYLEKEKSGTYTKVFGPVKFSPLKSKTELGSDKGSMILEKGKKMKSITENYRLRMWLSDQSLLPTGDYSIEIVVNGKAK